MSTFREFLVKETDDLQARYNSRSYLNTEKPGEEFNFGQSLRKNFVGAVGDTAVDAAADLVPGGNLVKTGLRTVGGMVGDYMGSSKVDPEGLARQYRSHPEAFRVSPELKSLFSPQLNSEIDAEVANKGCIQTFMQKHGGKLPPDYATQVAIKNVVTKFKTLREKGSLKG